MTTLVAVAAILVIGAAATAVARAISSRLDHDQRDRWLPWLMVAPVLAVLGVWVVVPAFQTVWLSLVHDGRFAGADHLGWLLSSSGARTALRNTVAWAVLVPTISVSVALGLAMLAERLRSGRLLVTVVLAPAMVSFAAVAVTWRILLAFRPAGTDQVGLLNQMVTTLGLDPVAWLVQPPVNTVLIAGGLVWATAGVCVLVLSAAIARVPEEVRDAARVDGADQTQVFARVTLPSIKGAVVVAAAVTAIMSIRVFDLVWITTGGDHGSTVAGTAMFQTALVEDQPGRGAALAVAMLVLIVPAATVLVRRVRRAEALR